MASGLPSIVQGCVKDRIKERIHTEQLLLCSKRLFFMENCKESIKAFQNATWSDKKEERLDEVSDKNPVDMLDAIEYAFQKWTKLLLMSLGVKR